MAVESAKRRRGDPIRAAEWTAYVVLIALALLLALCASCRTVEAVEQLPAGYWQATWTLVEAVALDVWSLVRLLLPV